MCHKILDFTLNRRQLSGVPSNVILHRFLKAHSAAWEEGLEVNSRGTQSRIVIRIAPMKEGSTKQVEKYDL